MKKQKELHKEYPVRGFRINDKTFANMKKLKGRQSWNLFFLELTKYYEKNKKLR